MGWRGGRECVWLGRRRSTLIRSTHNPAQCPIQFFVRPLRDEDGAVQAPVFGVSDSVTGRENRDRPERLELEDISVGEGLEGAAVVGISSRFRGGFVTLDE